MDSNTSAEDRSRISVIWGRILGGALVLYIVYGLAIYWFKLTFIIPDGINYWQFTEWLINYEGGFVRRGLLGEMLYWFCSHTGIGPRYIISFISLALYLSLFYFFFKKFRERGLCWWFLASPIMFGFVDSVIRKDFILLWLFISTLILLKNDNPSAWRRIIVGVLMIIGMFLHEAYIFFGAPVVLLLLADGKHRCIFAVTVVSVISTFILMSVNNGSHEIVNSINESWNLLSGRDKLVYTPENSIGALEWECISTFKRHFKRNIGYPHYCIGLFVRPVAMFFAYYMIVNFLKAFSHNDTRHRVDDQTNIGAVYILLSVCMLPMWTVLSCDYLRLYQYVGICTIGTFLVLDRKRIAGIFPPLFLRYVSGINRIIDRGLPVSKGWMLVIFLCWFDGPSWYSLDIGFEYSIFGKLSVLFGSIVKYICF